jgi:hypothetical protein
MERNEDAVATADDTPSSSGLKSRGKPFAKGNPGRKPGSKNKSIAFAETLKDMDPQPLLQKAYQLGLSGNVAMLKFLLERMVPRERLIKLEITAINFADDAVHAMSAIFLEVVEGRITPSEAAALSTMVNASAKAIELEDVTNRLNALEAALRGRSLK